MSIEPVVRFRRATRIAYSRRPLARLVQVWRSFASHPSGETEYGIADILLLPLATLALTLWLLGTVPDLGDAVATACSAACMP